MGLYYRGVLVVIMAARFWFESAGRKGRWLLAPVPQRRKQPTTLAVITGTHSTNSRLLLEAHSPKVRHISSADVAPMTLRTLGPTTQSFTWRNQAYSWNNVHRGGYCLWDIEILDILRERLDWNYDHANGGFQKFRVACVEVTYIGATERGARLSPRWLV